MGTLREWIARSVAVLRRTRTDADLEEELRSHLALAADARKLEPPCGTAVASGVRSIAPVMEALRDQRGVPWLADLGRDLRYATRTIARSPGFSVIAVATLAMGIGANVALFAVADALLLRPPPFAGSDRLHWIYDVNEGLDITVRDALYPSPANFLDWRDRTESFDHMVAWQNWFFSVAGPDGYRGVAEQVRGVRVSPSFFEMLGVEAAIGRTFARDEEEPGRDRVIMLTDGLWKRRYGARPEIVGSTLLIDGEPFSIVGVLPPSFSFLLPDLDLWMPFPVDAAVGSQRTSHSISVLARLAPGVERVRAQDDLDRVTLTLQRAHPSTNDGWNAVLRPVFPFNRTLQPTLLLLGGAVACVLLIACINVANLLLVRIAGRQRELAVRSAIGASRARLIRQLLVESALLAAAATGLGVLLATWSLGAIRPLLPQVQVARPLTLALDMRVLLFAVGASVLTTIVFGTVPVVRASRPEGLRLGPAITPRRRFGRALSIVEIGTSLTLLIGAILLVRSLSNLQRIDPGFRPEGVVTMQVWLPETKYPNAAAVSSFYQEALDRLHRFPEVRSAAFVNVRPLLGWTLGATLDIPEKPFAVDRPIVGCRIISPGFLSTLGVPLLAGRDLTHHDSAQSLPVALVNDTFARRFWPDESPIGKSIRATSLGSPDSAPWWPEQTTDLFTIVGVVGNVRDSQLRGDVEPIVYLTQLQNPSRYMHVLVRAGSDAANLTPLVERELRALDPDLGVYDARTMERVLASAVADTRFVSILLRVFAAIALLLAAVGVYGVTSHAVGQRWREFAIRLALGARPYALFGSVTREGLLVAVSGIALGVVGASVVARTFENLLYGVTPTDFWTLLGCGTVVFGIALLACWRPAWRVTKVDAMAALRTE
jgi:putative ABC transport system permease protein